MVLRMEGKVEQLERKIDDLDAKVTEMHQLLTQAKAARWILMLMIGVGGVVAARGSKMKVEVDFGCRGTSVEDMGVYRGMNPKFVQRVWKKRQDQARRSGGAITKRGSSPDVTQIVEQVLRTEFRSFDELRGVVALYSIPVREIDSKNRDPRVVKARHAAICAAKKRWPDISLNALGRELGVDHTSALHALRKYGISTGQPTTKTAA